MSSMDLRGFHWPLAPLDCKLQIARDAAQLRLANLRREEAELCQSVHAIDGERRHVLAGMAVGRRSVDPVARGVRLRHALQQGLSLKAREEELRELASRIEAARLACVDAERALASARKLRDAAQGAYAGSRLRAATKEADFAWLVSRFTGRSGPEDGS
ncbi:MAG TPA: hypothetical protein VF522_01735 [Ramlibacter sp.]|uniref:hypothetical protein n=1 Tax=Ramlibacter sp. TaxID=1917967 RepID=UPI002ED686CB